MRKLTPLAFRYWMMKMKSIHYTDENSMDKACEKIDNYKHEHTLQKTV